MANLKVISPTGCVHIVNSTLRGWHFPFDERYRTKCNHNDYRRSYGAGYYHDWDITDKSVTCKRCLSISDPKSHKQALEDIRDLTVGYDGFETVDGLKSLIDDMQNVAVKALNNERWYTHIPPKEKE